MPINDSKLILQIARGAMSQKEQYSEGMDISELAGKDSEAGKRERNRRMVKEGACFELREKHKTGRKPKFY